MAEQNIGDKIFILECIDPNGYREVNGYFRCFENAKKAKIEIDNYNENKKYKIKQSIIEIELED